MLKCLFVFGTRPEAIKLSPVILRMREHGSRFAVSVAVTGQHREMLDQVLTAFDIRPNFDLNCMIAGQTLAGLSSRILGSLEPVLKESRPDLVYVQGDTTTTLCGALAAFYAGVPVAHVEAGLRTGDPTQPFPEEMNRLLTGRLAAIHFAATEGARANLLREGIPAASIHVTGNSGIDAVLHVSRRIASEAIVGEWDFLNPRKRLIVVTAHRRESFGPGFDGICRALRAIATRDDVEIVFPVHPNPNVLEPVRRHLAGAPNVYLIRPLEYVPFIGLMGRAYLLLTDSGGIQEEGPSLGKPVIVMRETTERPEAVEAGTVRLAGTDELRIVSEVSRLLDDPDLRESMSRIHNPYGDGRASERIVAISESYFRKGAAHDRE